MLLLNVVTCVNDSLSDVNKTCVKDFRTYNDYFFKIKLEAEYK